MKPTGPNKVVGLALGERSILAAELAAVAGGAPEARRLAEFPYPDGLSLQQPEELGKALGAFLREHHFTARAAVLGLPAKWVMVKPKDVPVADATTTADLLRLQAEREFPPELKEMVCDFAGDLNAASARGGGDGLGPNSGGPTTRVLLLATPRTYVDGPLAMARAARLVIQSVTPTSAALAAVTRRAQAPGRAKNDLVLYLSPASAELTVQANGNPTALRHLRIEARPVPAQPMPAHPVEVAAGGNGADRAAVASDRVPVAQLQGFLGELRRAVALLPRNGSAGGRELVVWDGLGLDPAAYAALGNSTGLPVRSGGLEAMGVGPIPGSPPDEDGRRFAGAAALALAGLREGGESGLSVDFLHSRLAPRKKASRRQVIAWSALGLALVIGGGIYAYADLAADQQKWAVLKAKAVADAPAVKLAKANVAKISFAQGWFRDPGEFQFLECMKDLTDVFPRDSAIIATTLSVTLRDNGLHCQLAGRSNVPAAVNALFDQLRKRPHCQEVKLAGMNEAGKEQSFSINFRYVP